MKTLQSVLKTALIYCKENTLFVMSAFLIVFIPLFPKIPLFEVIPGYIVRARLEDVLIFLTACFWLFQVYSGKIRFKTTYVLMVFAYALIGITSLLLGTVLIESIPQQLLHIGKSALHLFRYLEYFALFFFMYSAIETKRQIKILIGLLAATILLVVVYGFGQQYLEFPLYSTMNREYSKGVTLYLQEGARPQSTFAGHYDLAAYLVIVLPIIFSVALSIIKIPKTKIQLSLKNLNTLGKKLLTNKQNIVSLVLHIIHLLGAWMLLTSGSKTAFFAYVAGIMLVLFQFIWQFGTLKQKLKWGSIGGVAVVLCMTLFLNLFARGTRDSLITLAQQVFTPSQASQEVQPDDLFGEGHEYKQVIIKNEDGTETKEWVRSQSEWSENALKYGISMGIRLDTLWPQAVRGFANNPLFGNGYATLSAATEGEFTEAESTDNNFLRTLGETGILGFVTFYGFILIILIELIKNIPKRPLEKGIVTGFIAAIVGLLINASYIDVFAASKVAYTFWAFAGLSIAVARPNPTKTIQRIAHHLYKYRSLYLGILILFIFLHRNPFHKKSTIGAFEISTAQLESLISARCFTATGSFDLCRYSGETLEYTPNLYTYLLVPLMELYQSPFMFYVLNMLLFTITLVALHFSLGIIVKKFHSRKLREFTRFIVLVLYTLLLAFFNVSGQPLSTQELFYFFIATPVLLLALGFIFQYPKYRMAILIEISVVLLVTLILINQNYESTLLSHYRNPEKTNKQLTIDTANGYFDFNRLTDIETENYLITTLNPYYVDLFSNKFYNVLPLTTDQEYYTVAPQVYRGIAEKKDDIFNLYAELLKENNLYFTNYNVAENIETQNQFITLRDTYDFYYETIGCDDACNIYSVNPKTKVVSPKPLSVTASDVALENLTNRYSFSIFSSRFERVQNERWDTEYFSYFLQKNITTDSNFSIITGDISSSGQEFEATLFNSLMGYTPILFTPGNYDITEEKVYQSRDQYFYTDSEFFIVLETNDASEITQKQRLFLYNAFLELERIDTIESIFIVSHELDWENRTNPDNIISDIERKLADFPALRRYIITSSHDADIDTIDDTDPAIRHVVDPETGIQYLSSIIRNWPSDGFLEFNINAENDVKVNYRVAGERFK